MCLIGSRGGRDGSLTIHQDVDLYASVLEAGENVSLDDTADRRVFVQVVSGNVELNGTSLEAGDGIRIRDADAITVAATTESEFLLFNLA